MGFLSKLLPMAAGAASTYFTGNPYLGMALAGGVTAQKTGSLQQGLMAGLSAYGGGQLAAGLQAAGTAQATNAIGQSAAAAGEEAAQEAIRSAGPKMIGADLEQMGAAQAAKANMLSPDVVGQSAREFAANAYTPTAAQTAALNNPLQTGLSGIGSGELTKQMGAKGLTMAGLAAASPMLLQQPEQPQMQPGDSTMPQRLKYEQGTATPFPQPDVPGYGDLGQDFGRQNSFFPGAGYVNMTPEEAKARRGYAGGGPVEQMSNANAIGINTGYPQADITGHAYATPWQTPTSQNVVAGTADTGVNRMTGQMLADGGLSGLNLAGEYSRNLPSDLDSAYKKAERTNNKSVMRGVKQEQGLRNRLKNPQMYAGGGLSDLGGYSDGGRLLKGPGDGVSDSIPAVIGQKQPARLADGEFVVPARIVSELGNGSTEAGARKLYAMMDRVQKARGKTVGKGKVAKNSRADRYLPA